MSRRGSIARVLVVALALAAVAGAGYLIARERAQRTSFALAAELAQRWEHALAARLEQIYGVGAIDVSVLVLLDDARRELQRDELDPSTAVALERAAGATTYDASRTREHVQEIAPRLKICRVTVRAEPRLALPDGAALRAPTEQEREALAAELAALARAVVPLTSDADEETGCFDLVLRAVRRSEESTATDSASALAFSAWPLAFGTLLLVAALVHALRRRSRARRRAREDAAQPNGIERARAAAARSPRRVARALAAWCAPTRGEGGRANEVSAQSAALVVAELGGGLAAAVLSALEPDAARRLALALDARPARSDEAELDALGARLAREVGEPERVRELDAAAFVNLCRDARPAEESAALEAELDRAAARRHTRATLEQLDPASLSALLETHGGAAAPSIAAALPPELAARWLAALDAPARRTWLERIAAAPPLVDAEREERLVQLADAATRFARAEPISNPEERLAQIVSRWPHELRSEALGWIAERDAAAAQRVREQLVAFSDLARLAPDELRSLLGLVELGELALALVGAPAAVEDAIESALAPRVRARLHDERASTARPQEPAVLAARERLVAALRELFERGEVELASAPLAAEATL